jgi:hypothetical protein
MSLFQTKGALHLKAQHTSHSRTSLRRNLKPYPPPSPLTYRWLHLLLIAAPRRVVSALFVWLHVDRLVIGTVHNTNQRAYARAIDACLATSNRRSICRRIPILCSTQPQQI